MSRLYMLVAFLFQSVRVYVHDQVLATAEPICRRELQQPGEGAMTEQMRGMRTAMLRVEENATVITPAEGRDCSATRG